MLCSPALSLFPPSSFRVHRAIEFQIPLVFRSVDWSLLSPCTFAVEPAVVQKYRRNCSVALPLLLCCLAILPICRAPLLRCVEPLLQIRAIALQPKLSDTPPSLQRRTPTAGVAAGSHHRYFNHRWSCYAAPLLPKLTPAQRLCSSLLQRDEVIVCYWLAGKSLHSTLLPLLICVVAYWSPNVFTLRHLCLLIMLHC